jgi:hypothetical protein
MSEYPQHGLHPDPDTLNAFVEGVLPEHERVACLQHFAECAACREVVYLAQEPLAPEPLPVPAMERTAWWKRWLKPVPVFGAMAAAGVLIFSIAPYLRDKPAANMPKATVAMSAPPSANEPLAPASPPVERTLEAPHIATRRAESKAEPHPAMPPDNPQPVSAPALSRLQDSVAAPQPSAFLPAAPQPAPSRVAALDAAAPAQSAITGTITDPSGAAIPNATVTVRQASGTSGAKATSDLLGQFFIAGLPPGQYELQVTSAGFQPAKKEIEVQKDKVARADSSLSVGSATETVEVTASAAAPLNTQSSSVVKSNSGFAKIPLVGRMAAKKSAPAPSDSVSLPSGLASVATATKGKVTLAADSIGTLYLSDNAGKTWKAVKAVWQGKVVELAANPPAAEAAAFRLTTDAGAAWFSRDGSHWYAALPQH